jgi:hypothetical protein
MIMADNVTLFPNLLQPTAALKTYAPLTIKFWENQETALEGFREFADGWFGRRHRSTQAAIEAAKRLSDATTMFDVVREYQNWVTGAMEALMEDGKSYQQQMLKGGIGLNPKSEERQIDDRRTA